MVNFLNILKTSDLNKQIQFSKLLCNPMWFICKILKMIPDGIWESFGYLTFSKDKSFSQGNILIIMRSLDLQQVHVIKYPCIDFCVSTPGSSAYHTPLGGNQANNTALPIIEEISALCCCQKLWSIGGGKHMGILDTQLITCSSAGMGHKTYL